MFPSPSFGAVIAKRFARRGGPPREPLPAPSRSSSLIPPPVDWCLARSWHSCFPHPPRDRGPKAWPRNAYFTSGCRDLREEESRADYLIALHIGLCCRNATLSSVLKAPATASSVSRRNNDTKTNLDPTGLQMLDIESRGPTHMSLAIRTVLEASSRIDPITSIPALESRELGAQSAHITNSIPWVFLRQRANLYHQPLDFLFAPTHAVSSGQAGRLSHYEPYVARTPDRSEPG
ncbi:hypothetical protein MAPG_05553 [Magnaporthiopsis poae ATCC 64411]|uniref:Uncharacterized protein n=1 Tax=Magnaporthiopsis poae (strain ATCC 64411 / 73-15) TaxID=644358 RepID=A0A0C4DZP7_MAGP6|nr:hypothetical protein MAPG_05553 [Magnaporthiopsis poae ATCC 64411]